MVMVVKREARPAPRTCDLCGHAGPYAQRALRGQMLHRRRLEMLNSFSTRDSVFSFRAQLRKFHHQEQRRHAALTTNSPKSRWLSRAFAYFMLVLSFQHMSKDAQHVLVTRGPRSKEPHSDLDFRKLHTEGKGAKNSAPVLKAPTQK